MFRNILILGLIISGTAFGSECTVNLYQGGAIQPSSKIKAEIELALKTRGYRVVDEIAPNYFSYREKQKSYSGHLQSDSLPTKALEIDLRSGGVDPENFWEIDGVVTAEGSQKVNYREKYYIDADTLQKGAQETEKRIVDSIWKHVFKSFLPCKEGKKVN